MTTYFVILLLFGTMGLWGYGTMGLCDDSADNYSALMGSGG